jgi:hypothetical protein
LLQRILVRLNREKHGPESQSGRGDTDNTHPREGVDPRPPEVQTSGGCHGRAAGKKIAPQLDHTSDNTTDAFFCCQRANNEYA